jgi:hypothetical protein
VKNNKNFIKVCAKCAPEAILEWGLLDKTKGGVKIYASKLNKNYYLFIITKNSISHIGYRIQENFYDLKDLTTEEALALLTKYINKSIKDSENKLGLTRRVA